MAYETVDEFIARLDPQYAAQLTSVLDGNSPESPVNRPRVQRALDDASDELDGYLPRLPAEYRPAAGTLRLHTHKVATYLLTLGRPGAEFEQIRNAYTDTIRFYTDAIAAASASGGSPPTDASVCAPAPVFSARNLRGFT